MAKTSEVGEIVEVNACMMLSYKQSAFAPVVVEEYIPNVGFWDCLAKKVWVWGLFACFFRN